MDTNITFRIDSQTKLKMAEICSRLGMTTSTAFNIFANAFVRANGMPFAVQLDSSSPALTQAQMLSDAEEILDEFAQDYKRMAE